MRSSIAKIHLLQVDRGQGGEQRERSSWGERWPDCHGHGGSGALQAKKEDIICVQEMWSQERCQPWHRDAVTWAQVTLNGTVLKWQEERKVTSANVEDWSFEHPHLADVPRACFGHWPTTSCPCFAFQDGLGLLAHFKISKDGLLKLTVLSLPLIGTSQKSNELLFRWATFHFLTQRKEDNCISSIWGSLKMSTKR